MATGGVDLATLQTHTRLVNNRIAITDTHPIIANRMDLQRCMITNTVMDFRLNSIQVP